MIKEKIQDLLGQVENLQANTPEEVEALRIKYLSKKGLVTELFNDFREVPKEEKREIGQLLNQLRQAYEDFRKDIHMIHDQMMYVIHIHPYGSLPAGIVDHSLV